VTASAGPARAARTVPQPPQETRSALDRLVGPLERLVGWRREHGVEAHRVGAWRSISSCGSTPLFFDSTSSRRRRSPPAGRRPAASLGRAALVVTLDGHVRGLNQFFEPSPRRGSRCRRPPCLREQAGERLVAVERAHVAQELVVEAGVEQVPEACAAGPCRFRCSARDEAGRVTSHVATAGAARAGSARAGAPGVRRPALRPARFLAHAAVAIVAVGTRRFSARRLRQWSAANLARGGSCCRVVDGPVLRAGGACRVSRRRLAVAEPCPRSRRARPRPAVWRRANSRPAAAQPPPRPRRAPPQQPPRAVRDDVRRTPSSPPGASGRTACGDTGREGHTT